MEHTKTKGCLDSLTLKLLAMALMLCDHLWATVLPGVMWLTAVGRIAFPIFAFQVAEGFQRTHDRKKYLLRMLAFALISEIPFNYLYYSSPVFPFHQNVMFTFFIALLLMLGLEKVRSKGTEMYILAAVLSLPVGYFLGTLGMVDYYGSGVVTVLIFYLCRQIPHGWIGEVAGEHTDRYRYYARSNELHGIKNKNDRSPQYEESGHFRSRSFSVIKDFRLSKYPSIV